MFCRGQSYSAQGRPHQGGGSLRFSVFLNELSWGWKSSQENWETYVKSTLSSLFNIL